MELFTLGIGNYTESDVRESARAWTGWRVNRRANAVSFDPALHDAGRKTFLGRTGALTGDDVVDIIFAQPQCARFFAASLLNWFVYNDPEPELVDRVASLLRRNDYELAPVVAAILTSNVFYSERSYRALVKSPVEFVVGVVQGAGAARDRRRRAARAGADGPAPVLSAERRGLAGRRKLADERHDDRAPELPDAAARIAGARRIVVAARASGGSRRVRRARSPRTCCRATSRRNRSRSSAVIWADPAARRSRRSRPRTTISASAARCISPWPRRPTN